MRTFDKAQQDYEERMTRRLEFGNAWLICNECGAKLKEFEGHKDLDRSCPFKRNGHCEPR